MLKQTSKKQIHFLDLPQHLNIAGVFFNTITFLIGLAQTHLFSQNTVTLITWQNIIYTNRA